MSISNQEAFDKVLTALREQGVRSFIIDPNAPDDEESSPTHEMCQYRGPNGIKCAAGHLIPDEKYNPRMEGKGTSWLRRTFPELNEDLPPDWDLVGALQAAHDYHMPKVKGGSMASWEDAMKNIAKQFGLEYKEPEK